MPTPLKKVGKDTLVYLPATLIPALASLIVVPIFTRLFAPEQYGYYSIAATTIALLTAIFTGWIGQSAIRFFEPSLRDKKLEAYHSTVFFSLTILIFLGSTFAVLLLSIIKPTLNLKLHALLQLSIFCFASNGVYRVYLYVLRAAQYSHFYSIIEIFSATGRIFLAIFAVIILGFGIESLLIGFLISTCAASLLMLRKLRIKNYISIQEFSWESFKDFYLFGYPLSLALISSWLLTLSNRYLIGWLRDSTEVGLYSISSSLSERPLNLFFSGIMLAAYPIIVDVWENLGRAAAESLINDLTRYYLLMSIPIVVLISIFAKEIVILISTEEYAAGHSAIPFIATGTFFYGLSQYVAKGFELQKKTSTFALIMLAAGILNILLTALLVVVMGFQGAGVALMISYIFLFLLLKAKVKSHLCWHLPKKSLARILVSSILMGAFAVLLRSYCTFSLITLILVVVASLALYLTILFLIGEIQHHESKAVRAMLRSFRSSN